MKLTNEQKDTIHSKLLAFGKAYYDAHEALKKGDTKKFAALVISEVHVGRDFITFLESL